MKVVKWSSFYHKIALVFVTQFPWCVRQIFQTSTVRLHTCTVQMCRYWELPFAWCLIQLWAVNEVKADAADMQIRQRGSEQKRLRFALAGISFTQFTEKQEKGARRYTLSSSITSETQWCVRRMKGGFLWVDGVWDTSWRRRSWTGEQTHLTDPLIMFRHPGY